MIPYGHQWLDEGDIAEVAKVLRSDWITQGPRIDEFERGVAAACGASFGVAFSSGTAALHAACFAAGLGPGDEVITTPMTFVATANAVIYQGGVPVFADIDPETLNIDPSQILKRLTPRTKGILPVHFAGLPCSMGRIQEIARERGLVVIEDACHALGAEWRSEEGRREKIGSCSHSDMAVFSFHPVKQIATGEGGMCLTNREDLRNRLKMFRHHGITRPKQGSPESEEPWRYEMIALGYNYRITDFQCALGLKQLEKLETFLKRREEIAARYTQAFEGLGLTVQRQQPGVRHAWHIYTVGLPLERLDADRRRVFCELREEGIGVGVHYIPVYRHPFYQEKFSYSPADYPVAEAYYQRALTLPLFPSMTQEQVQRVIQSVRAVWEKHRRRTAPEAFSVIPSQGGAEWEQRP